MSPTQLSLKRLRAAGYFAAISEHWNSYAKLRQDLFGFVDIVALGKNETLGIQTTSYSNVASRVKKIRASETFPKLLEAGWRICVHGWHKKDNRWVCREVEIDG